MVTEVSLRCDKRKISGKRGWGKCFCVYFWDSNTAAFACMGLAFEIHTLICRPKSSTGTYHVARLLVLNYFHFPLFSVSLLWICRENLAFICSKVPPRMQPKTTLNRVPSRVKVISQHCAPSVSLQSINGKPSENALLIPHKLMHRIDQHKHTRTCIPSTTLSDSKSN